MDGKADPTVIVFEEQIAESNPAKPFWAKRKVVLISICAFLLIILVIVTPCVKLLYFDKQRDVLIAQNQEDASRYAVVKANFPDPCLIKVGKGYYSFATRPLTNTSIHIQVASAPESISRWTLLEGYDALPNLPPWVKHHGDAGVWAPQVSQREDGMFVMVYSALHKDHTRKHCLGMATSSTVLGPYDAGNSSRPLVCNLELGGIIDPTFISDPMVNTTYLVYKNDGNAIGSGGACANANWPNTPTTFEYNSLQQDWTTFPSFEYHVNNTNFSSNFDVGSNKQKFLKNARSDGPNIESPQAWFQEYPELSMGNSHSEMRRAYHVMYNSGCYADKTYRIEHLVCWLNDTITSFTDCPWQKLKNETKTSLLLQSGIYPQPDDQPAAVLIAPGGPGVDQDGRYMAFHADIVPQWFSGDSHHGKAIERQRALFIAELEPDVGSEARPGKGLKIMRLILPQN